MTLERKQKSPKKASKRESHAQIYHNAQNTIQAEQISYQDPEMLRSVILSYSYEQLYNLPMSRTTSYGMRAWLRHFITFLRRDISSRVISLWKDLETLKLETLVRNWNNLSTSEKILEFERVRDATHQEGTMISKYFGWESEALEGIDPSLWEETIDPGGARQEIINEHCRRKVNDFFVGLAYAYD
jgi:hypothetical protein